MKSNYLIGTLSIAIALTQAAPAFAGHSVGSGGNGIEINGKLYLLDLVEAGKEEDVYFDSTVAIEASYASTAQLLFSKFPKARDLVARKLSEIARQDRWTATVLRKAFEMYAWRWVAMDLVTINDYDGSDLEFTSNNLYQLAVRDGQVIRIDQKLWVRLTPEHQAALLFHEVVYAFFAKESRRARDAVGVLFSKDLERGPDFIDGAFNPANSDRKLMMVREFNTTYETADYSLPVMESSDGSLQTRPPRMILPLFASTPIATIAYPGFQMTPIDSTHVCQTSVHFGLAMAIAPYFRVIFSVDEKGHTFLDLRELISENSHSDLKLMGEVSTSASYGKEFYGLRGYLTWPETDAGRAECRSYIDGLPALINPMLR
jgi:hypothetical protein